MPKKNLIEQICKGKDKKYKNKYCNHFSFSDNCRLLEGKKKLEIIFSEKGLRCEPKEKLTSYAKQFVKKYKDVLNEKDSLSIAYEAQIKIAKICLTENYNIYYLYSYMKKAAKTATLDLFSMFSSIKLVCNNCVYLLPDKKNKYVCSREILLNGKKNKSYKKKRKPSNKACKYGFEIIKINTELEPEIEEPDPKEIFHKLCEILKNRYPKSKTINRQYVLFVRVCQITTDGTKIINKKLAKEFGVDPKTIERDLKEIRMYLKEYISSNYVSFNDFISSL